MVRFLRAGWSGVRSKITRSSGTPSGTPGADPRRALIWHDAVRLSTLAFSAAVLFGVTLFCFRSFEGFEAQLARDWNRNGVAAIHGHRPAEAVRALRTSLNYERDAGRVHDDQVLLAEALADDGRLDEARDYFLALWDSTPGDGLINLQLARIAHRQHDDDAAVDYYRDAIDGSWPIDAIARRNDVRVELADLLIDRQHRDEARNVLLVAAANAPDDASFQIAVGMKLQRAGFTADALGLYEKASVAAPKDQLPLKLAGQAAFDLNRYAEAEEYLNRALKTGAGNDADAGSMLESLTALDREAHRLQQLYLGSNQPAAERAVHLLEASKIAQDRLAGCVATAPADALPRLRTLQGEWSTARPKNAAQRQSLAENPVIQDFWTDLIDSTEMQTAGVCGSPTGDDALLLRLAKAASVPTATAPSALPAPETIRRPNRPSFFQKFFPTEARQNGK